MTIEPPCQIRSGVAPSPESATRADHAGAIEVRDTVWIPLADGTRLAATLWLPADQAGRPAPAIFEFLPYRRRDIKSVRDHTMHAHYAAHGFAGVRVDLRGTGDSDGIIEDEYTAQELSDACEVIAWIADQPWCSGKVGMQGISWGGFNALQVAALRPPALSAILTLCSTDDRYADDIHYMGGCLLTDNLSWASNMLSFNACPPDPAVVGAQWRAAWHARLRANRPLLLTWLAHQRRDAYWRHGSVCEDPAAIRVPVMAAGGWRDGYSNAIFRLMRDLEVPRRAIVGSWGHRYPHLPGPGPEIDFLGEAMRWWERWLMGVENGVEDAPMLQAWIQDPVGPEENAAPGRWVAEPVWPSPAIVDTALMPSQGRLCWAEDLDTATAGDDSTPSLDIRSPLASGLAGGKWCVYGEDADMPRDQRLDDGGALIFDTAPLARDVEILGQARLEMEIAADRPVAQVAVRLSQIGVDGASTRVSYGVLNLTHRDSHAEPAPLEPGRRYRVTLKLNDTGQRFCAGNRIRLSVSSGYWPMIWPAPDPETLTVWPGSLRLILPVRPGDCADGMPPLAGPAHMAPPPPVTTLTPAEPSWCVTRDLGQGRTLVAINDDAPRERFDNHGMEVMREVRERFSTEREDVASTRGEVAQRWRFQRHGHGADDLDVTISTRTVLTATTSHFRVSATFEAFEGEQRVHAATWDEEIPRDLV